MSEKRVFPDIDVTKSSTRRDDLLMNHREQEAMEIVRKAINAMKPEEAIEKIFDLFVKTRDNDEFVNRVRNRKYI